MTGLSMCRNVVALRTNGHRYIVMFDDDDASGHEALESIDRMLADPDLPFNADDALAMGTAALRLWQAATERRKQP